MSFTKEEINHVLHLAYHSDLTNVALALALMQGRPWQEQWRTPLFWMFNRCLWAEATALAASIEQYFLQHHPVGQRLPPLLLSTPWHQPSKGLTISPQLEPLAGRWGLDLSTLAQCLFEHFPLDAHPMNRFLFRYGNSHMRRQLLPHLWHRLSTGTPVLNLSDFRLGVFPAEILDYQTVEQLDLSGNQLQRLPDAWTAFKQLKQLNLSDNQLEALPLSLMQLPQLERLYLKNNAFTFDGLLVHLRHMPHLQQLIAANGDTEAFRVLEQLVQAGLLQQPIPLQEVFLALQTQGTPVAHPMPSTTTLLQALGSQVPPLPQLVRDHLLSRSTAVVQAPLPASASIAVLGLVTFATRLAMEQLAPSHQLTTQLTPTTTHIVLGDQIELQAPITARDCVFLSEQQLQMLAK